MSKKNAKLHLPNAGFTGYSDAPAEIDAGIGKGKINNDLFPATAVLNKKTRLSRGETAAIKKTWKRYRIQDHERGHRPALASVYKEKTKRLDTSLILPAGVYSWVAAHKNKAAFIREALIRQYAVTKS